MGLVGESGSGKTMTCLSILKLLPRGAEIVSGQILFDGQDITKSSDREMEKLRGKRIGMILQNSMAALDPVFTIGTQIGGPLVVHQRLEMEGGVRKVSGTASQGEDYGSPLEDKKPGNLAMQRGSWRHIIVVAVVGASSAASHWAGAYGGHPDSAARSRRQPGL